MKRTFTSLFILVPLIVMSWGTQNEAAAQDYIGSQMCINCHQGRDADVVNNYIVSGHPYKLNAVDNAPPTYPDGTSPGVVTPPNTAWGDFAYVIGGYGWKARFVKPDGRVYTVGDSAQYNLEALSNSDAADKLWVPYHKGEDKKYNYNCFKCHTTGAVNEGSWNGVADDSLGTFSEPGIRCEACHGPGSDHMANPVGVKPPNEGEALTITICGSCHNRSSLTNEIPASGGYIRHHEQLNEMRASRHGDGVGDELTCASCHNTHVPLRYPDTAVGGLSGIETNCETCHENYEVQFNGSSKGLACIDCHMPSASKSAIGLQVGNGWRGDVKTHIMAINTNPVTKTEAMFTADGGLVALDGEGLAAVTMDFACLQCHTDRNVVWAADHASGIHTNGLNTSVAEASDMPVTFELNQNYPNPFNPNTTISFDLPRAEQITLSLYSADGRLVETLLNSPMPAGTHEVEFDARFLASGVYLYKLKAGNLTQVRTMTLLK